MSAHIAHRGPAPSHSRRGFTLVELMVVVAVVAIVCAVLMPAFLSARRKSARIQCINNCKQIGLALHNYEQAHHSLPPAFTTDADGRPRHGWRTLILPYMNDPDLELLFRSIDLAKPWDDPANATALSRTVLAYYCPNSPGPGHLTTYLGVATPDGCFPPGRPRELDEITDGQGSTLMVLEVGPEHAVPWMAPVDAGEPLIMGLGPDAMHHQNAAFADGSVRSLKPSIPAEVRRALISVAGGEKLSNDQY